VEFSGLISNGDKSTVMMAAGVDPDSEFAVKGPFLTVTEGRCWSPAATDGRGDAGRRPGRSLKATPGSSLTLLASTTEGALNAMDVTGQGRLLHRRARHGQAPGLHRHRATAQKLLVTPARVQPGRVPGPHGIHRPGAAAPGGQPPTQVQTWLDQAFFYKSVRDLYNRIFGALGLIIGVIVVFVVTNAMAMAIIERTREIGTLRAMGTLPGQLLRSWALEGMVLGGVGAWPVRLLALAVS
jgi:putative ABC transport system permease protein